MIVRMPCSIHVGMDVGFSSVGVTMLCGLLILVPLALASGGIRTGKASDFYVEGLPDFVGSDFPTMHSGKIDVGSEMGMGERNLFFWHVQAEVNTHTTILWLNGGPGCSSMDGSLLEVGPFRLNPETKQIYRSRDSWSSFANLLFLDQPFGTGYSDALETESSGLFVNSLEEAAKVVAQFLYQYSTTFPEIRNTKIYLAGESFAGQYIPHIWKILKQKPEIIEEIDMLNQVGIHGVILIAPWIDPAHQYLSQPLYAKQYGLIESRHYDMLDQFQAQCMASLERSAKFDIRECEDMNTFILQSSAGGPDSKQCFNIYDSSKLSPFPSCGAEWPSALPAVSEYLTRHDVQKALHAIPSQGSPQWKECSGKVHNAMQRGRVSADFIGELIEDIPLIVIAGDNDWICNHIGLEMFIRNLKWNGSVGFTTSQPVNTDYGSYQSERGLTFIRVANGTHMLPVEHLELSGKLVREFLGIDSAVTEADHGFSTTSEYCNNKLKNASEPSGDRNPHHSPNTDEEAINRAIYKAYKQAGVVALITVLVMVAILGAVCLRRGHSLSGRGLVKALLQVGKHRGKESFHDDRVPLRPMGRRPSAIPEEDEEDHEFDV